jgi:hypothetical protein
MVVFGPAESCTFSWNPSVLTLEDLALFTSLLLELHNDVAVPYVTEQHYEPSIGLQKPPRVARISMGSPLVTQVVAGSGGIVSLGMIGFILRNPDKLGAFLPRIRESWNESSKRALEAKFEYIETRAKLQARGEPIQTFEREYYSRNREQGPRDRRRR